jgi:hypothetical protein
MNNELLKALDCVTWYNCYAEDILKWKEEGYLENDGYILSWDWDKFDQLPKEEQIALQIIWMICVSLFGDYGTSPRSGWILMENKEAFFKFIDDITTTYREPYGFEEDD